MTRLTTTKLAEWLKPSLTSGARVVAGRLPAMPNRLIAIQMQSGPGLVMEGIFDIISFQVTSRGAENNLDDAETIAMEVDNILIGNQGITENFLIGTGIDSVYVSTIGRTGGGPSQSSITDSESRWMFTCNYFAYVSTDLGSKV